MLGAMAASILLQATVPPQANIHDLYVSCYLFARLDDASDHEADYSLKGCAAASLFAVVVEGPEAGIHCLPRGISPAPIIANTFVRFYQERVPDLVEAGYEERGTEAMLTSLTMAFPCPTSGASPSAPDR